MPCQQLLFKNLAGHAVLQILKAGVFIVSDATHT